MAELRKCSKCKSSVLLLGYFSKNRKGEYYKTCDTCRENRKAIDQRYREKNKETIKENHKKHRDTNKEKMIERWKEYRERDGYKEMRHEKYEQNKVEILRQQKIYYNKNKEWITKRHIQYTRNRRKNDPLFRCLDNLRCRLYKAIKFNVKSQRTKELLGCSGEELKEHLEQQFEVGMSWGNHGNKGWHIDHILPCVSFDMSLPEEQKKCFHYTNLQPLWWYDNLSKGSQIFD